MIDEFQYNIITIGVCLFILTSYSISSFLINLIFPNLHIDQHLVDSNNTILWLHKHREKTDAGNVQLAVQTLRNTNYVAIFIGGITFQLAVTVLNTYPTAKYILDQIRIVIVTVLLFISFLCWASVIRSSSHLGFLTGVLRYHDKTLDDVESLDNSIPLSHTNHNSHKNNTHCSIEKVHNTSITVQESTGSTILNDASIQETQMNHDDVIQYTLTAEQIEEMKLLKLKEIEESRMNQESLMMYIMLLSFSLGFRFLFIAFPFVVYSAGPEALIISTVSILLFMWTYDHAFIR